MKLTQGAIGNLINRYRAVLKKCHLLNTFGSLAVASMLVMGGAGVAQAEGTWTKPDGTPGEWTAGTAVQSGAELSGTFENFISVINNTAGVAVIGYNTPGVSVADGTKFLNNSMAAPNKGAAGGALKILTGTEIGNNVHFENNSATEGAGWGGGALYIKLTEGTIPSEEKNVTIGTDSQFIGNKAKNLGGAIALEYGNLEIKEGAIFSNNTTTSNVNGDGVGGGAIAVWHDPENGAPGNTILKLHDATFEGNSTISSGGAIYNSDGIILITDTKFIKNEAARGGAIYHEAGKNLDFSGNISIEDSCFYQNTSNNGGAVWLGALTESTISGSKFIENHAYNNTNGFSQGGAITNAGKMTITDSIFSENTSDGNGGAIANVNPSATGARQLTLEDVNITGNSAGGNGGGIFNADLQELVLEGDNTITENISGSDNTKNDLYNEGTTKVASGTTTLDALTNNGDITVGGEGSAATFVVQKSWDGTGDTTVANLGILSLTKDVLYNDDDTLNSSINATINSGATLAVTDLDDEMTLEEVKNLKETLTSSEQFAGSLYLDGVTISDLGSPTECGHYAYGTIKDIAGVHVDQLLEATVDVTDDENVGIGGGYKSVHLTGDDTEFIAKGKDLTLAGSTDGGNLVFKTDEDDPKDVANLRIGSENAEDGAKASTTVTLGRDGLTNKGILGNVVMNAGKDNTATLNVVGSNDAQFKVGTITTNDSFNKIVISGAELVTNNISADLNGNTYKDLDELQVTNGGRLTANGVAELDSVILKGGTVHVKETTDNPENTGTVTIAELQGQGSVIAKVTELTQALTTQETDALALQGDNVIFSGTLDSKEGQISITAEETLTTQAVTLQDDFVNAKKWILNGGLTAGKDSIKQVAQFGNDEHGASNLTQTVTLNDNALLVHGNTDEDALNAARDVSAAAGNSGATYYAAKSLNLGNENGKLYLNATEDQTATNNIVFGKGSLLVVDSSIFSATDDPAVFTSTTTTNAVVAEESTLYAINVHAQDTFTVFDTSITATEAEWQIIRTDTPMLEGYYNENKDVAFRVQDPMQVFPGLSEDLAPAVYDLYYGEYNNVDASEQGVRFLSRATNNRYLGKDKAAAASTIESAARMAFAGAVPQMTKMASDAATNSVVNRMGFANPENGAKAMNMEGKLVDDKALGLALWIAPLWSNQTGFGMEAGNLDYGYNANLGGVSLGADYTWANNFRAGLMFNIGGGYAQSSGDLSDTTNAMTFWGIGAYAGWKYENFAVMGDVSYTSTWNSVDQDVDYRMGMSDLEADIQASAISAGLRGEYKFETSALDIIPHVGVRYMSINTWGYDVDNNMGTVLEGDGFQQNIWTFPVGVTFSKELEMNNDWYFKPSVDFTVIPAAGDIKAREDVRFTGMPQSYEVETQMMDYFTWQGGVGLEFGNDNMSVGVNYTLQAGQNSTGHGVFGMFRYEF